MTHWQDYNLDPPDTGWIESCVDCDCDVHVDELIYPFLCDDCRMKRRVRELRRQDDNEALRDIARGLT